MRPNLLLSISSSSLPSFCCSLHLKLNVFLFSSFLHVSLPDDDPAAKTNGEVGVNGELEPEDKEKPAVVEAPPPAAAVVVTEVPAN